MEKRKLSAAEKAFKFLWDTPETMHARREALARENGIEKAYHPAPKMVPHETWICETGVAPRYSCMVERLPIDGRYAWSIDLPADDDASDPDFRSVAAGFSGSSETAMAAVEAALTALYGGPELAWSAA